MNNNIEQVILILDTPEPIITFKENGIYYPMPAIGLPIPESFTFTGYDGVTRLPERSNLKTLAIDITERVRNEERIPNIDDVNSILLDEIVNEGDSAKPLSEFI